MSVFSKRHYEAVARVLALRLAYVSTSTDVAIGVVGDTILDFAQMFEEDNPAFDREVFMAAVGVARVPGLVVGLTQPKGRKRSQ